MPTLNLTLPSRLVKTVFRAGEQARRIRRVDREANATPGGVLTR